MKTIHRHETPITIQNENVELRTVEAGGMLVGFVRLRAGTDLSAATVGLPDDLCPCPHWGYMLSGRVQMRTKNGSQVFSKGDVFYWGPGHAPMALEDSEYVDFSPAEDFEKVIRHLKGES